jgi:hypothetical protein
VRRAVSKLAAAGLVETTLLHSVRWHGLVGMTEEQAAAVPHAQRRVLRPARRIGYPPKPDVPYWAAPRRDGYGNRQLHVRLAQTES